MFAARLICWGALLTALCGTVVGFADDWPQWGGPQRDLAWREKGIVKELKTKDLLPRVWSTPIGSGYAGPAVANGKVFVMDRSADGERVLCLNADTGKEIWKHEYAARYTVSYPLGPRCTPTVDDGRVFTVGAMGHFFCFNETSGDVLWQKTFVVDFGTRLPTWGMVHAPLIDGNQVIILVGGQNALVVSFDKVTGQELWRALDDREIGYAPPMIFTFGQHRQLIIWHPSAITSLDPANGQRNWQVPYQVRSGLTVMTPRQVGNRLFVASFYNGPRMIEVADDGKSARVVWSGKSDSEQRTDGLHPIIMTPVFDGSYIYGIDSYGHLRCLDATNGQRKWETLDATGQGRWWNCFLVPHEDRFFLHNEQGELLIAKLTPAGYQEISRAKLVEPTQPIQRRMTVWSHPAFAMKSVFARNDKEIVRVSLAE
ncbi:MAG: pyrrolo-quinoline quinone [Planctomycetes bacterium]|nr:pyrrolo-quinoline quinone [Planctomycetota bacterium]